MGQQGVQSRFGENFFIQNAWEQKAYPAPQFDQYQQIPTQRARSAGPRQRENDVDESIVPVWNRKLLHQLEENTEWKLPLTQTERLRSPTMQSWRSTSNRSPSRICLVNITCNTYRGATRAVDSTTTDRKE